MKSLLLKVSLLCVIFSGQALAQKLPRMELVLKNGIVNPERNIDPVKLRELSRKLVPFKNKAFVIIQFDEIPSVLQKESLKKEGIELLDYVPNMAYTATVSGPLNDAVLRRSGARSILNPGPEQKLQNTLARGIIPAHAKTGDGSIDVWISFIRSFEPAEIIEALEVKGYKVTSVAYQNYQVLELRIPENKLMDVAGLPYIQYIQAKPKEDTPVNNHSVVNGRANVLASSVGTGLELHGEGVVVGVGDNADPLQHTDLVNRVINRMAIDSGTHGVHVMGTLGGAGIVNEKYAGYAPKVKMISQYYSNILAYAPVYVQDFGMVITNNSYGNDVSDCSSFGDYDLASNILDQQAFQMPYLQHVFAAGNSGATNCAPFVGFGNVIGGYQAAKNVLTVGNTTGEGVINLSSSKGPVSDGRIKPEISAQGTQVVSSYALNNGYINSTGTSMAAPAVSGGLALLYQQYRKRHNQNNPKNGLMKALICNGSTDKGNPGPDFQYGYGWLNLLSSIRMLEADHYKTATVANSVKNSFDIQIPANTALVKVMLYWNDPAASILAAKTLVNDLDLTVETTSGSVILPKLLDPGAANVSLPAVTGVDHTNNMEQAVINNPAPGTYKIHVNGNAITQGSDQEYYVVYDIIPVSTTLTYPIGKERLAPDDQVYISWDAFGLSSNEFQIKYSKDNGGTWANLPGNALSSNSLKAWTVPADVTDKARIKIVSTATGEETISAAFTIIPAPVFRLANIQCEGYVALEWNAVAGATDYEVMILRGDEMVSAGTTPGLNFIISGLSKDLVQWVSVRARINGNPGPRASSLSRKPDSGTCAGSISNNDLILETIVSPASSGRQFTSSALSSNTGITIRIKNLDDQTSSGDVSVRYNINNGNDHSFVVPLTIGPGAATDYTFPIQENLASLGTYTISATVSKDGDLVDSNNSASKLVRQLPNQTITLPFTDNLESAADQSYTDDVSGLTGADRYDFTNSTRAGRIRTFVNSGMANSGNRALTLDADRYSPEGNTNFLYGTFNLSNYNLTNDIRLYFRYKNHGQNIHPDNKVWIRGNYNDPWISIYDLAAEQNRPNQSYKLSKSLELRNILQENGQDFSASTQIRWGQHGTRITADPTSGAGYSFDDISLKIETNDVQLLSINSIAETSCGLGNQHPLTVSIRNSADNAVNNVSVSYKLGSGQEITEIIPSIGGRQTIQYTFVSKLDLSASGPYNLKVSAALPTDSYPENNSVSLSFYNNTLVAAFPYLENFETGNGNWHSAGTNSSWAYGNPSSAKINKAASGTKAWKTNLTGNYNNQENSYLYSPCFDLTGMANPTLSLSLALDIEYCPQEDCDLAFMEYSVDGNTWLRLGSKGQGTNWYTKVTEDKSAWSVENYTRWHVGTIPLPATNGTIRFRVVMNADPGTTREGIAIDDVHLYDRNSGIYDETTTLTPVSQQQPNNAGWIDFKQNGKLVVSINPNGQPIGTTAVQAFFNTGTVRNDGHQYYLDRNVTIKPGITNLAAVATVRLYFLDSEIERLIGATGCSGCTNISSAYQVGVSKYTDTDKGREDGEIGNNISGIWSFITAASTVKVPYDKGYYAEISVRDFSEFWFSNGGITNDNPLPVELISFSAVQDPVIENPDKVTVTWATSSEVNADRFEIERAVGNENFKSNRFAKIGTVPASNGHSGIKTYQLSDDESHKAGIYYYRLKMVDHDGRSEYSASRSVSFDRLADWVTYPNPSRGSFEVQFQATAGAVIYLTVSDLKGNLVFQHTVSAHGSRQKQRIDLSDPRFKAGVYVVEVISQDYKKVFRVLKL